MESSMIDSDLSLKQVSDNLIAYLRSELNDATISYDIPLTPIVGGYETRTFRFKLKGVKASLSNPLVLRLFRHFHKSERAIWESVLQNALAGQGYPVPSVHLTCTNKSHLGGEFLLMDFLPGQMMLAVAGQQLPVMLGTTHAALHQLAPEPLTLALRAQGACDSDFRLSGRLSRLSDKAKTFPWLADIMPWLQENRSPEPERLSICHGDFHALNILVKDRKVSGVLDWSGFLIADPILDVAYTVLLTTIAAKHLMPINNWQELIAAYLEAYRSVQMLELASLDYYRVLRCVIAFVDGAEGQALWREPGILKTLTEMVFDVTKIRVSL